MKPWTLPELVDGLNVLTLDDNHFFGQADVAYYITDDFKVNAGYRYINEASFGAAGAEYLIRGLDVPLSLFARGDFGDENIHERHRRPADLLSVTTRKVADRPPPPRRPQIYMPVFPTKLATKDKLAAVHAGRAARRGKFRARPTAIASARRAPRGRSPAQRRRPVLLPKPLASSAVAAPADLRPRRDLTAQA